MNATIKDIREGFAQELVAFTVNLKNQFDLPTNEAMVALYTACALFEAGAERAGMAPEKIKEMKSTGFSMGHDLYSRQEEMVEEAKKKAEQPPAEPGLGQGRKLGQTAGEGGPAEADEERYPNEPDVVGPDDGTGVIGPDGQEVRPEALTLEGSQVVVSAIGGATMELLFPMGAKIHPLDSLALASGVMEFIQRRLPKDIEDWQIRRVKQSGSSAVSRAIENRKDGKIRIDNDIFGPDGPQTKFEENKPSGLIGPDGRPL